ncbi:SusC/RagA family TonB-linked outer membrane protein [Mucilaginibacter pocheonensis]|uniref:TonB-linked SusC/RagA family outer membrane protein n=1 Tax=Mucilaginibacter pocheonensis TaxID=398050 RepID=A0ABU1TFZ4_9SPHI|nr:SusC/RagA family TonB-linked outer membrane protein [Mucilaginibacter pocheonensis]MDR6943756.1 TonB-linked SusC/RagA family outer membrane protein [Mucilaginibacter pocheonensis]
MYKKFTLFFCTWKTHAFKSTISKSLLLCGILTCLTCVAFGQTITLKKKNVTLKQVFNEIHKQTGYSVLIAGSKATSERRINVSFDKASLNDMLHTLLEGQSLEYTIEGKTIVIRDQPKPQSSKNNAAVPPDSSYIITGRVVDEDDKPLPGASISVEGNKSSVVALTQPDGSFKFFAETGNIMTVSYIGYQTIYIKVSNKILGTIKLIPFAQALSEVKVTIGYGTTTQRLNTGNVATVTSNEIKNQPVSNVLEALQGRVPGLVVTETSGFSSTPFNVTLRGQNNLSATNSGVNFLSEPLYVIDGVPMIYSANNNQQQNVGINQNAFSTPTAGQSPLFGINPTDIESVSILKDADATAIYGARGANGVILITTKKGKAGNTIFNANVYTGESLQTHKLNLMNTDQYLNMRRQAFKNDGLSPDDDSAYDLTIWDQHKFTDWQKYFLGTAHTTDAELSISGGNDNTTFRLSGGFNNRTPPFHGNYKEQRGSMLLSVTNSSLNNKLTTNAVVNFSATTSDLPSVDPTSLIFLAPNAPDLFTANGSGNWAGWAPAGGVPYQAISFNRLYNANTKNLMANLSVKYQITPDLDFSSSFGYNITRQNQLVESPSGTFNPANPIQRQSEFGENNNSTWIIEPALNYHKTIGKNNFQALLGATFQDQKVDGTDITARGYTTDALLGSLAGASGYDVFANDADTRFESGYARINYNYDEKYLLTLNGRRDGSSRFASGKQFGNFGSVGAAWIFSEESFVKDKLKFLSFGKLRGSFGLVGSDAVGDYKYLSTYSSTNNNYQGTPTIVLNSLANDKFGWTTTRKTELAIDLGFLKNQLNISLAAYRNRSGNQLVSYNLPSVAGFTTVIENLAALVQNQGLEFTVQSQNISTKDFSWNTSFNISRNTNKLLAFPDLENSSYNGLYAIGRSITSIGMFKYAGVDPATGLYTFADVNNDGQVDPYGNSDYIYKETAPAFFGGLGNNVKYKDFQLNFFFSFTKQHGVLRLSNALPGSLNNGVGNQLVLSEQLSGKPASQNLTTAAYRTDLNDYFNSDAVWVDASYIRLQNLSLSYNLPGKLLAGRGIQRVRIYVSGENLLTITGYKGTDPASPGSFSLPPRKILTAGLEVGF